MVVSNREAMSAIRCGRQPAEMSAPDCQSREAAAAGSPIPPHFCRRFAARDPRDGCFPWADAHGYLLPSLCDSRLRLGSGRFEGIERDWTRRIARGLRPKSQGADAQWHSLWGGFEVVRLQKIVKTRLNSHEFSYVIQNVNSKFAQSECHWASALPLTILVVFKTGLIHTNFQTPSFLARSSPTT